MNKHLVKVGMIIEDKHVSNVRYLVTKIDKEKNVIYAIGPFVFTLMEIPIDTLYHFKVYGRYTKEQIKELFDL